jgi:hypothetical protein
MSDKILGRDDLLSGNHLKRELVPVPELDGSIYLREFSTPQVIAFNRRIKDLQSSVEDNQITFDTSIELMALAISLSACDESGQLLFSEEDVNQLLQNKLNVLLTLSTKALAMSGLDLSVVNGLTSEVAANLKKARTNSLSSTLPENSKRRKRK